jgi:hypothetical protein
LDEKNHRVASKSSIIFIVSSHEDAKNKEGKYVQSTVCGGGAGCLINFRSHFFSMAAHNKFGV